MTIFRARRIWTHRAEAPGEAVAAKNRGTFRLSPKRRDEDFLERRFFRSKDFLEVEDYHAYLTYLANNLSFWLVDDGSAIGGGVRVQPAEPEA